MTEATRNLHFFFIVPDQFVDYTEFLQLGNVLYSPTEPDNVLAQPRLTKGPHPLGSEVTESRPSKQHDISPTNEAPLEAGFYTTILELLGLTFHTSSAAAYESSARSALITSTFKPTPEFLSAVKADADVYDVLLNSQERCVFLITGVVVTTGVQYIHDRHGPVTLAYRVQKLQLRPPQSLGEGDFVQGAYFDTMEREYILDEDTEFIGDYLGDLQSRSVVHESSGEEYVLYTPQYMPQAPGMKLIADGEGAIQAISNPRAGSQQDRPLIPTYLTMVWDLMGFYRDEQYEVDFQTFVKEALVITGTGNDAEATTTGEYLRRNWPDVAEEVIRALQRLSDLDQLEGLPLSSYLSKATQIDSSSQDEKAISILATFDTTSRETVFNISGSSKNIDDTLSALTWMGAGLQSTTSATKLRRCHSNIISLPYGRYVTFTVAPLLGDEEGTCWFDFFGNINIVSGSTPEKPPNTPGLEIALDKMALLVGADRITQFSGSAFLKGFDAMLVLVKQTENICIWHLLVNEDGEHISYTDERVQEIHPMTFELNEMANLGSYRHIVGWYKKVENLTGQRSADYNSFKASNLDPPRSKIVLDRFTLSGGQHINAGFSFALARRQKPLRGKPQTLYEKQIEWSMRQHVILFDVETRRAWLVNGRSALLHLVRASLQRSRTMHNSFLLEADALEEAASTMTGTGAVDFVLQSPKNRMLKLFKLDVDVTEKKKVIIAETMSAGDHRSTGELIHATEADVKYRHFKDEVADVYNWLELIVAAAKDRNFEDGHSIQGNQLIGHDFLDLINGESILDPKTIRLESRGKSWMKSVREAHAITLFGSGFGDLLKPLEMTTPLCSHWNSVPTGKDYLTVSVEDLKTSLLHGDRHDIDQAQKPFESCDCDSHPTQEHCERGQILIRKDLSVKPGRTGLSALPEEGAIVFGQPDLSAQMMKSIVELSTQVKRGVTDLPMRMRKRVSNSASVVS